MSFWCLFLDPHQTTQRSITVIVAELRPLTLEQDNTVEIKNWEHASNCTVIDVEFSLQTCAGETRKSGQTRPFVTDEPPNLLWNWLLALETFSIHFDLFKKMIT